MVFHEEFYVLNFVNMSMKENDGVSSHKSPLTLLHLIRLLL
jgi:hypothetical protein